ncbi:hypothetical protein [Deinococcus sp. Leaf326]|uniref:hypothetical protein n=1 Tax=Deinococcus sp. Leaf326 TaxID=1736338 RepID=UPI0006FCF7CC|nr:hypothetical protein [Deinococcus sp. Leaf326]KQR28091.1 hypothetical protein ASF71_05845 [Deinococcus sp. Leaf326]
MNTDRPVDAQPEGQARSHVSEAPIMDPAQWNTGTPKNAGDPATEGQYTGVSDANAEAGADTSTAEQVARQGTEPLRPVSRAGDANPSTYGGMQAGLPASGATSQPDQTIDAEEGA